jgi:hypothetical protein
MEHHETNAGDFHQDAENEELNLVEGSAPCEAEKEAVHGVAAADMGAPATPGVMAPPVGKKKGKLWMMEICIVTCHLRSQPIRRFIARRQLCKYATILQALLGSLSRLTMEIQLEGVFYVVCPDAISRVSDSPTREKLPGEGQQHIHKTDPSSCQRGRPTKTRP